MTPSPVDEVRVETHRRAGSELRIILSGRWGIDVGLPDSDPVVRAAKGVKQVVFDCDRLDSWDSTLVAFVAALIAELTELGAEVESAGLPDGVQRFLRLASAVPEVRGRRRPRDSDGFVERTGRETLAFIRSTGEIMDFLGQVSVSFARLLTGRARYRKSDLTAVMQEAGADAVPIVSLISFLVGVILAYIGQSQLARFGAKIYVADLVSIAMVRDMGAIMTAIIMAGRTGAAFAAHLGTMTANEEIDALRTLGLNPIDFLVLPRMLALMLMMPLLTLYANLMGITGGAFIAVQVGGLTTTEFVLQVKSAVQMHDVWGGLFKGFVYGAIVACSGCLRGVQCGRNAAAVGDATTSAVVTAIVFIVVSAAVLTVVYDVLGI